MQHQMKETCKNQSMNFEVALQVVNEAVLNHKGRHLKNIELEVLRGVWLGYKYDEIAAEIGYAAEYIKHDVGPKLWQILTSSLGEKVSKNNLMAVLAQQIQQIEGKKPIRDWKIPLGVLSLDSDFYIERSFVELRCNEEILKPGALIRIVAPNKMGKTSLMLRTLAHARLNNSDSIKNREVRTITLSFQGADKAAFSDLDKFLQWLCTVVTRKLQLPQRVEDYWCNNFGSKNNCTTYFEEYLLPEVNAPLVLALDKIDEIFSHPEIAEDFFSLLHSWHEEAAYGDNGNPIWQNLRLIIVHSSEVYIYQNISKFRNIGLEIELKPFTEEQVLDLASRYKLQIAESQLSVLMNLVGGHPYLVQQALYHLACQELTLDGLLKTAATNTGIYSDHLNKHLHKLQEHPQLAAAYDRVIESSSPVELEPQTALKLYNLGLVTLQDKNQVVPRCGLYWRYFGNVS
jgi:hypothetical protein